MDEIELVVVDGRRRRVSLSLVVWRWMNGVKEQTEEKRNRLATEVAEIYVEESACPRVLRSITESISHYAQSGNGNKTSEKGKYPF